MNDAKFPFFPPNYRESLFLLPGGKGGGRNSQKCFNSESANRASATGKPSRSKDGGGGRNAVLY